ncbi:hypothetical protein ACQR3P_29095 [Rhodococcus sp. IEGM1300]
MSNDFEVNLERAKSMLSDYHFALDHNDDGDPPSVIVTRKDIVTLSFLIREVKKAQMYAETLGHIHNEDTDLQPPKVAMETLMNAAMRFETKPVGKKRELFYSDYASHEKYNGMTFEILSDEQGPNRSYTIRLENGITTVAWAQEIYESRS